MTDTNNTNGSNTSTTGVSDKMTVKELVAHYNTKAKELGLATVKDFKTKALALARIAGLAKPADTTAPATTQPAASNTLPAAGTTTEAPADPAASTATTSTESAPASPVATPVTTAVAAPAVPAAPAKIKIVFSGEVKGTVEVEPNSTLEEALKKANNGKAVTGMMVRGTGNAAVARSTRLTGPANFTVGYQRSGG